MIVQNINVQEIRRLSVTSRKVSGSSVYCLEFALGSTGASRIGPRLMRKKETRQRHMGPTRISWAIWNDADLDIPILKQAKAEYSTLK